MKISKKVCDGCRKETGLKEMYLSITGEFSIALKYLAGIKSFPKRDLDFCSIDCFKAFLDKLLLKGF